MNIKEFTPDQKQEIEEGLQAGLDVSVYAKPEFLAIQMQQIRLGMLENLPVACYASTDYDWFQMEEIRKGLSEGIDISKYADCTIPFDTMRQIREGLLSGIDISVLKGFPAGILKQFRLALLENIDIRPYIKEGYSEEQLQQIRLAKEKGLEIEPYLSLDLRGTSIQEIALGLEAGLDVSVYAKHRMNWQQMREIRLGLEKGLDTSVYQKELYSWQQMREIRLGLEEGLPVDDYSSLMYTAKEMHKRRMNLLSGKKEKKQHGEKKKLHYKNFELYVAEDFMEACVLLAREGVKIRKEEMLAALNGKGVITGIDYHALDRLDKGQVKEDTLRVAKGTKPVKGKDGWFEYFFDTELKKQPKVLANGMVDYQNIKCFEIIKKDEKVAYYHEAEEGVAGRRINGERIPAEKGKELRPLPRKGVILLPDKKTYIAATEGKIELKAGKLEITSMLVLGDVTQANTNVMFNGAVYIRGFIGDGAVVKATRTRRRSKMKYQVLIVDDAELNRELLKEMLLDEYDVLEADNGKTALEIIDKEQEHIHAILLDLVMPVMDGFEVLAGLQERKVIGKIPVLVISGENTSQNEKKCFDYGVSDFIGRPFNAALVKLRVKNMVDQFVYKNRLEEKVQEQTAVLRKAYETVKMQAEKLEKRNQDIIEMLGTIVEYRNLESGEHVQRVKGYTKILAEAVRVQYPEYGLTQDMIDTIVAASALHDLGKIAIPDSILLKPGRLDKDEFEYMKSHTIRGCEILESMKVEWNLAMKSVSLEIIRHHHERYDGKGYPDGLKGDEIPISAQLVSIADVYDALINERCYKDAYSKEEAFHMIVNGECGVFSPKLLETFRSVKKQFEDLSEEKEQI